jgi:hypothetical protein
MNKLQYLTFEICNRISNGFLPSGGTEIRQYTNTHIIQNNTLHYANKTVHHRGGDGLLLIRVMNTLENCVRCVRNHGEMVISKETRRTTDPVPQPPP